MKLLYVIGPPGCGKSSAVAALVARWPIAEDAVRYVAPFVCSVYRLTPTGRIQAVQMGRNRLGFPGTDTLSMGIAPAARAWIAETPVPLVIGEGDRLAIASFFDASAAAGRLPVVAYLDVPPEVCAARREARGSHQDPAWIKGRETKALRLAEAVNAHVIPAATIAPAVVAALLYGLLTP